MPLEYSFSFSSWTRLGSLIATAKHSESVCGMRSPVMHRLALECAKNLVKVIAIVLQCLDSVPAVLLVEPAAIRNRARRSDSVDHAQAGHNPNPPAACSYLLLDRSPAGRQCLGSCIVGQPMRAIEIWPISQFLEVEADVFQMVRGKIDKPKLEAD